MRFLTSLTTALRLLCLVLRSPALFCQHNEHFINFHMKNNFFLKIFLILKFPEYNEVTSFTTRIVTFVWKKSFLILISKGGHLSNGNFQSPPSFTQVCRYLSPSSSCWRTHRAQVYCKNDTYEWPEYDFSFISRSQRSLTYLHQKLWTVFDAVRRNGAIQSQSLPSETVLSSLTDEDLVCLYIHRNVNESQLHHWINRWSLSQVENRQKSESVRWVTWQFS